MTTALEGGEWSTARPGRTLHPGKTRYPFYRRLGGPHGRSGRAENLVPTGIPSRIVQPVVIRYTDWATRSTKPAKDFLQTRFNRVVAGDGGVERKVEYSWRFHFTIMSIYCQSEHNV